MNPKLRIAFLVSFFLIAFGALCMSQTFARTSLPHYLCWISAFAAIGGACYVGRGFKVDEDA